MYGLGGDIGALSGDEREMLREAYAADPTWASRGDLLFDAPPPLSAGRLVIELLPEAAPKTVENFRALISGSRGVGKASGKSLNYAGVRFHRIVKDFMMQVRGGQYGSVSHDAGELGR